MASEITRSYLRGRLIIILVGFVLAVAAGAGFMLWQSETAKTGVKFGAVIGQMAEATSDVLYHSLRLDNTRIAGTAPVSGIRAAQAAGAPAPRAPLIAPGQTVDEIRADLQQALARLENAYKALQFAVEGEVAMGESRLITAEEERSASGTVTLFSSDGALADISGLTAPESVGQIWNGTTDGVSLERDIKEVLTHADRLDIIRDFSHPSAQRVFAQLREIANERVRPNLAAILDRLDEEAVAGYGTLQITLLFVAFSIVMAGALIGLRVFEPMAENIARAHDDLRRAKEVVETARVKAESADRAKSEFLANMSHEIRTPMNGVLGMAELLAKTSLDQRQTMFVDIIVKSGNALLTIINDILDFSKIDAGQLELDPAPFRIGEAIEDVATLVSARVAEKDLELIVRVDPDLPSTVVGDIGRFRQIATNLIGNGVKFTERGHVLVDVSGELRDDVVEVTVRVEDTGIGIPPDKLEAVFEKFAQVDASSTRRHEGTGLGLAIASRLVDLMGGRMGVESEFGRGSVFWFTAPFPIDVSGVKAKPIPVDVTGARILVIDDNAINREILLEQLRSWGFDCAAAESGGLGLAFLDQARKIGARVDCVILDYQMPGMNGADVAKAIMADPGLSRVPVVLLTSVDLVETGRLAVEYGIAAQLHKPARSSALLETLVSVMQTSRASIPPLRPAVEPIPLLPRKPAAPPVIRISADTLRQTGALDVLVAEDNEVNQIVFSQMLDRMGLSYRIACNGRAAVEMNRTFRPRIILMDVSMPEVNGLEATREIRDAERGTGERVPIIGVTAHALKGDRDKCIEAGMDDYLSKPVSPEKLTRKVDTWMGAGEMAQTA